MDFLKLIRISLIVKSVHTAGKSAIKLVNLLSLKVIQLKGAKIYM